MNTLLLVESNVYRLKKQFPSKVGLSKLPATCMYHTSTLPLQNRHKVSDSTVDPLPLTYCRTKINRPRIWTWRALFIAIGHYQNLEVQLLFPSLCPHPVLQYKPLPRFDNAEHASCMLIECLTVCYFCPQLFFFFGIHFVSSAEDLPSVLRQGSHGW
jgi:hypothetical protein